jgi:hypothetical protein
VLQLVTVGGSRLAVAAWSTGCIMLVYISSHAIMNGLFYCVATTISINRYEGKETKSECREQTIQK